MLMDNRFASGQGMTPVGALELHHQVVKAHGVAPIDCALKSLRKNHFQIPVPAGYKRRSAHTYPAGSGKASMRRSMLPNRRHV
jgi:hypothetical protein